MGDHVSLVVFSLDIVLKAWVDVVGGEAMAGVVERLRWTWSGDSEKEEETDVARVFNCRDLMEYSSKTLIRR